MRGMFLFIIGFQLCGLEFAANVAEEGRVELQKFQNLAAQRYGECWSLALQNINARCQEFTADMQSRIALRFTHCHLQRSNRPFPECPEGSEVSFCTRDMDPVAFNAYTEFFTHAHSICHYLQSESWQHQAENTIHRLTESSAGVVEKLTSTQRMAEDLVEAQSAALKSQETILRNGEELKHTLHHSTQGLREVFAEMKLTAHEQQVAFSEIFNRVTFLQSFILSESHTLNCVLYNSLAFCTAFLLTSTRRTSSARLVLFGLVGLNVYLERIICRAVLDDSNPGYQQMEQVSFLVVILRRVMVLVGLLVLVFCVVRFRDVTKESLEILTQLRETQSSLKLALQQAESLSESLETHKGEENSQMCERQRRREREKEECSLVPWSSTVIIDSTAVQNLHTSKRSNGDWLYDSLSSSSGAAVETSQAPASPARRQRRSSTSRRLPSSPVVYSILVEDKPRYNLRNRRSSVLGPDVHRNLNSRREHQQYKD
ncbi:uncharacterized protein LOC134018287 isoform X1 [Osmerus eperlanus]|uniref:uncharacterized protein LOC134018287 isoform X1 n=2 Tax=Osmerus eperlanus TaxID=29151 RepID=UPI002E1165A5